MRSDYAEVDSVTCLSVTPARMWYNLVGESPDVIARPSAPPGKRSLPAGRLYEPRRGTIAVTDHHR
jgi:hypothetical protein